MQQNPLFAALALAGILACTTRTEDQTAATTGDTASGAVTTPPADDKVANAMSAGPPAIASSATIMDWPATEGGEMKELRAGTNGWVCYPNTPATVGASGEDPMCLDKTFQGWAGALMSKKTPPVKTVGIGYMFRGDRGVSNTDPFATVATADNEWVQTGPHMMIVVPNAAMFEGIPTDHKGGGPFVMWKGTPYAHVMVPVSVAAQH